MSTYRGEEYKSVLASGLIRKQYIVYYPLLVYNSFKPDNSELIVTNMARRNKVSQVVNLGANWNFISFVESPCQAGQIDCI